MKNVPWKEIAELIGVVAIVLSLVFVGLQLKQEQVIGRFESAMDYDDTMIAYSSAIIENADTWKAGLEGFAFESVEDEIKFQALAYMAHRKFAGIYRRGTLLENSENLDSVARQFAGELYVFPGLRRVFEARCEKQRSMGLSPVFCAHVVAELSKYESGENARPEGDIYIP